MRVRCRVYYQGENNAGGLHGNAGTKDQPPSGYACMMPKLVSLFRKEWSKEPHLFQTWGQARGGDNSKVSAAPDRAVVRYGASKPQSCESCLLVSYMPLARIS